MAHPKKNDPKKTKENGGKSIAETLKTIKERFGEESVMTLDDSPNMDVEAITTGSFGLDIALGIGGYPKGRIIEIFGPESSGKTTLALHAVAEAQKTGGICAYIDAEHALDPEYARNIGVNTKDLLISQPENGEQALEMVDMMVRSNKFAVIVIDSVASLTPKAEIEGEMGDQHIGRHAKLMSQALRKLVPIVSKSNTVVIFINQIRMNIGAFPGTNPEFTTGGKALKFYSSVRLDIRRIAQIKKGEDVVGGRVRVKVVKNKVAAPFKQTEFDLLYGEGISHEGELLALGEMYKIILKSGNSYSYGEIKLGRGYDASRQFLKGDKKIAKEILHQIRKEKASVFEGSEIELEDKEETLNENG